MSRTQFRYDDTPFGDPVTCVAGLLVAGDDRTGFNAFGSGFLAGPDLAVTARHVIDDISRRFTGKLLPELQHHIPFGVQLATSHPVTGKMMKWDVKNYHYSYNIDITALTIIPAVDLEDDFVKVLPRFELIPPRKGTKVFAFGYPDTKSKPVGDGSYRIKLFPRTSQGIVKEVHPLYRDTVMLPFPCFQTNARFDAGMSGGPVFNGEGRICAVVSTNMPPGQDGGEHYSHASLIWPMFGLRFNEEQPGRNPPRFLRSEAEAGRIQAPNWECISIQTGADHDNLRLRPPPA